MQQFSIRLVLDPQQREAAQKIKPLPNGEVL